MLHTTCCITFDYCAHQLKYLLTSHLHLTIAMIVLFGVPVTFVVLDSRVQSIYFSVSTVCNVNVT